MSYVNLINSNVSLAFNLVKDLAVDALIVKASRSDFDFTTGATDQTFTSLPAKAIFVEEKKSSKEVNTSVKTVMIKTRESGDISTLDKLSVSNVIWNFTNIVRSNGYITIAEVAREV